MRLESQYDGLAVIKMRHIHGHFNKPRVPVMDAVESAHGGVHRLVPAYVILYSVNGYHISALYNYPYYIMIIIDAII